LIDSLVLGQIGNQKKGAYIFFKQIQVIPRSGGSKGNISWEEALISRKEQGSNTRKNIMLSKEVKENTHRRREHHDV